VLGFDHATSRATLPTTALPQMLTSDKALAHREQFLDGLATDGVIPKLGPEEVAALDSAA